VFHVELRRFPHNTHAFNLEQGELRARVLYPWLAGKKFEFYEAMWSPEEARLTVLEGPRLQPGEIAMGRGWANAMRHGTDVTERVLSEAADATSAPSPRAPAVAVSELGRTLLAACVQGPVAVQRAWALADEAQPGARASERLALAEQAVGELAAGGLIVFERAGQIVAPVDAGQLLLVHETWTAPDGDLVLARITTQGAQLVAPAP
jgi:hypothetical protein